MAKLTITGRWKLGATVFISSGIAFLATAAVLRREGYPALEAIAMNLGVAALAIVLIDTLWRVTGGDPLETHIGDLTEKLQHISRSVAAVERGRIVGLSDVHKCQADVGLPSVWEDLLSQSKRRVDIMARTAAGWLRSGNAAKTIIDRIQHGDVSFRWLIMSHNNEYLKLIVQHDPHVGTHLDDKIADMETFLRGVRAGLPAAQHHRFQVRTFQRAPLYCSIVRVDDTWHVTHYLFSRPSDRSPVLCVKGENADWSVMYDDEFEAIWKDATDLFPDSTTSTPTTVPVSSV